MKKLQLLFLFLLASVISFAQLSELGQFLKSQSEIKKMEVIPGNAFFNETWEIMVRQPLDHLDTTNGFFLQRVFIADRGAENATLFITEGYAANYAKSPQYINELSPILNTNQICVEHRYFGNSRPDSINWDYLTVKNAAADHHAIIELFKKHYSGQFINTGISKGGQTAVYHRTLYPNDVDITVAYVAPLNFAVEDRRHSKFLATKTGTEKQRKKLENFQLQVLKERASIMPKLVEYSNQKKYNYRIPLDEVLDYCVLEYPFAFWQWGKRLEDVPSEDATVDELFNHLMEVSNPSYFALEGMAEIQPFFIQAQRELGYYGYSRKHLKNYLHIKSTRNYLENIFLPENVRIDYQKNTAKNVRRFIRSTDKYLLFIYGEFDPWSASAFDIPKKDNLVKIVNPGGSHKTRINNLPAKQKEYTIGVLESWLEFGQNE